MIDKEGNARIMDFGIARSLKTKGITGAGVMIGTPEYMSPEQAEVKEVDQRSDIYSLGVILYEMVTGRVPFEGETPLGIAMKHKNEMPKDPRELNAQLSEDLSKVILRCMEKDKEKRYQSAGEARSELARIEKGIPTTDRVIPKRKSITSREITVTFGLKKLFVPALAVVTLAIIALIIWKLLPQKEVAPLPSAKPSIAVLPFEDLSLRKDQEYFCDGLAEELINRLANIENIRVPARASAFSFKNKDLHIQEIGEKLNVEMVLDGSVRKAGNKLRITVQLVKATDGYPVWSKIYERNIGDTFALQDEISLAIIDNLKIKLLAGEKAKLVRRHTENIEAYNLYLQGRFFMNKRNMNKAVDFFEQAIKEEPAYAIAYANLSYAYATIGDFGIVPPKEAFPKAKEYAKKALELDGSLGEAYNSLAIVKHIYEWDWQNAEKDFKRAIELNPDYAPAHQEYAEYLTKKGRFEEALQEIKYAQELEPFSVIFHAIEGLILSYRRHYDQAIEKLKRVINMDPELSQARNYLGWAYLRKGIYEEALAVFQERGSALEIAFSYAKLGKLPEAQVILGNTIEESRETYVHPSRFAKVYFVIGDNDQGFKWLERGYEKHDNLLCYIKISPEFDSVRSDPRFKALLKKINLE
jgi:TolB-like protein